MQRMCSTTKLWGLLSLGVWKEQVYFANGNVLSHCLNPNTFHPLSIFKYVIRNVFNSKLNGI